MPRRELVIVGSDGVARAQVVNPCRKVAVIGDGMPTPSCCGPRCGCNAQPGCNSVGLPAYPAPWRTQGTYSYTGGEVRFNYTERKELFSCCCGSPNKQRYRFTYTSRVWWTIGAAAGQIRGIAIDILECDALSGTLHTKRYGAFTSIPGTQPVVLEDIEFTQTGVNCEWCRNQGQACFGTICSFGQLEPFYNQFNPEGVIGVSGTFRGNCTSHHSELHLTYATSREESNFSMVLDPDGGTCRGPSCARACCLPDGSCRDDLDSAGCLALGGQPNPAGVTCFQALCEFQREKGRCCVPSTGECLMTHPNACLPPNVFGGLYTTCVGNPCPQPLGACCLGLTCSQTTQVQCQAGGGAWQGPGTACQPSPCIVGGACCRRNGTCTQVTSAQACADLQGIFFPGGDCQAITCPECCFVDEPERTYTLNSGGETIVFGATTHCCWERAAYTLAGGGEYKLRFNFQPPGCYEQERYFSFEQQLGGQWQLVVRIVTYPGGCGTTPVEAFDRINIDRCTSADAVLNLMVGNYASGGTGTRHTTCSTGTASRIDNQGPNGTTATLDVSVSITGGTACAQNCGTDGLRSGDIRVLTNPIVVPDGAGGWMPTNSPYAATAPQRRGCSSCNDGKGF